MLKIKQENPKATDFLEKVEAETDLLMAKLLGEATKVSGKYCIVNAEEIALTMMAASMHTVGRIMEFTKDNHPEDEADDTYDLCVGFTMAAVEHSLPVDIKGIEVPKNTLDDIDDIYKGIKKAMH